MNSLKSSVSEKTSGYSWVVLALTFFLQASASMAVFSFGPMAPFLRDDLEITRAQVGMFTSIIYLGMVFFGTHAGWLTDKFGIRFFLLAGPGAMGLVFLCLPLTHSFIPALSIVFIAGLGYQFINPTTVKTLSRWFPPRMRGTAISIKQSGISFGGAVGAVLIPVIALAWGWRGTMIVIGGIILAVVFLCRIYYRESSTGVKAAKSQLITMKGLLQTITKRNLVLQSLAGAMYCIPSIVIATYLVLYLKETLSISVVVAGTCLMVAQLGTVAGRILWGVISDRLFAGKRKNVMIIMGVSIALLSVIAMLISSNTSLWLIYTIFTVFGFSTGIQGLHVTFLAELAGEKMAATGVGFGAAVSAGGMVIATPIFGYIVDMTNSYRLAWLFVAILGIVGAGFICFIREDKS
ncbi:MAG: MFS transporter [Syntrophobacterales bacterium]|nr:MFS transporter [Syntrophobacterales bacterium]